MTININDFENRVHDYLATGLMDHYRAQLAHKHGYRWLARRWFAESRTRLDRDLTMTLLLPLRGRERRRQLFEQCASSVKRHDSVWRRAMTRHVAERLRVPLLEHTLDDADTIDFWQRVEIAVDCCLREHDTEGESPACST